MGEGIRPAPLAHFGEMMMDAEGRIIPTVEDDQGEGSFDLYDDDSEPTAEELLFDKLLSNHADVVKCIEALAEYEPSDSLCDFCDVPQWEAVGYIHDPECPVLLAKKLMEVLGG